MVQTILTFLDAYLQSVCREQKKAGETEFKRLRKPRVDFRGPSDLMVYEHLVISLSTWSG